MRSEDDRRFYANKLDKKQLGYRTLQYFSSYPLNVQHIELGFDHLSNGFNQCIATCNVPAMELIYKTKKLYVLDN